MSDTKNTTTNTSAVKSEWQNRELGALWKKTSSPSDSFPRGRTYLTGKIKFDDLGEEKTTSIVVFSNTNKKNEKAPDFRIYVSKEAGEKTEAATPKKDGEKSSEQAANAAKAEWQSRELGALWKRTSAPSDSFPRGRTYLTGKIKFDDLGEEKTTSIVVFSNTNKKNEKAPDFRIYVSKETGEKAATTTRRENTASSEQSAAAEGNSESELL